MEYVIYIIVSLIFGFWATYIEEDEGTGIFWMFIWPVLLPLTFLNWFFQLAITLKKHVRNK